MKRFALPVALLALPVYLLVAACGSVPDALPAHDPAIESAVSALAQKLDRMESEAAARAKALDEKVAAGLLARDQAEAIKASDAAHTAKAREMADEIAALNRRLASYDEEIKRQFANLPSQGMNSGIVGVANGLLSLGLLLAARAGAKKEIRRKIAEFDALPENVAVMPDGSLRDLAVKA